VGATGLLGTRVVRLLRDAGRPVRALVRTTSAAAKRSALEALGAEICDADLKDPSSLDRACRGVTAIVSTASATLSRQPTDTIFTVDHAGQLALIDAAEGAHVDHLVFISFPPRNLDYALQRAKRAVETRLRESRLSFTILQPVSFFEVWLGRAAGFDPMNGAVQVFGRGDRPISWISVHDVARFAAAAVDGGAFAGKVLPLGGPDALSPLDVVRMFEEMAGRSVAVTHLSEETLEARLAGARDPFEETYAAIMLAMARGLVVAAPPIADMLPGRLSTVRDHLGQILGTGNTKEKETRQ
jgi:NADH dehydrogenase